MIINLFQIEMFLHKSQLTGLVLFSFFYLLAVFSPWQVAAQRTDQSRYIFPEQPKRIALVIGNKSYKNLAPIESSIPDAESMASQLKSLDFEVDYYADVPTLGKFQNEILPKFRKKFNTGDFIVFYFSGHGFSYGDDNYLVPTDMPLNIQKSKVTRHAISVSAFKDLLASHSPGMIMFFIDACRSIGGFMISDEAGQNLVAKGYTPPRETNKGINTFIVYATRPGDISIGSTEAGQLSVFTSSLVKHLGTEGKPFRTVFDDIATEVLTGTNSQQDPGKYDWSKTDPFFKPTFNNLKDEKEAWISALDSRDWKKIEAFSFRHSVSEYSAACRKWLSESEEQSARYTKASPDAIERAWNPLSDKRFAIKRINLPFGFPRSLESSQEATLSKASDDDVGLIPVGVTTDTEDDSLSSSLSSLSAHKIVITTQDLPGLDSPNISSSVVARIPSGSRLQINDVVSDADNNSYLSVSIPDNDSIIYIKVNSTDQPLGPLELGKSIKEIIVSPRPNSSDDLVDSDSIKKTVSDLTSEGWKITWVSLSTASTDDESELAARYIRLANSEYILKSIGVESRRITSVAGKKDFSGEGVRIRFFGFK